MVVLIRDSSRATALPERVSCTKRSTPLITTMPLTISTAVRSLSPAEASRKSVTKEMTASSSKTTLKGLIKALKRRLARESFCLWVSAFSPWRARSSSTCEAWSPSRALWCSRRRSTGALCAASSRRRLAKAPAEAEDVTEAAGVREPVFLEGERKNMGTSGRRR